MSQERILLDHGGGGGMSQQLIERVFVSRFGNPYLNRLDDGAVFRVDKGRLAFSTDSYVVSPLFFPGGDIGCLAVNGTVNDLAMCGARPLYLSAGFIIEEGFLLSDLERIADSMQSAATLAGVRIITGDTKVVDKGACDGVFINTAGVGLVRPGLELGGDKARPGDAVIVSGFIGDHGVTVICEREGFGLNSPIRSDSAPLGDMVENLLDAAPQVHALRDPTRGGLATSLNEIAQKSGVGIQMDQATLPIREEVKGACELLGLDPLYLANEGKLIALVPEQHAQKALEAISSNPYGKNARIIGRTIPENPGRVAMRTAMGTSRIVDMLAGTPLPRIC
jgi:hydrogenase expression/formation protein HypE